MHRKKIGNVKFCKFYLKIKKIKSMLKWFTGFLQLLRLESTIEFSTFGNDPAVGNVHGNTRNYDHGNISIIFNCWILVKSGNIKPVTWFSS